MTRTSKTLRRLGVVAVAAATIGAGIPAFFAAPASANHVSGITLTPDREVSAVNTCNPFTIRVNPAQSTVVDVTISQTTNSGTTTTAAPAPALAFCQPGAEDGPNPAAAPAGTTAPGPLGVNPTTNAGGPAECAPGTAGTTGGTTAAAQGTTTCSAEFTTNAQGVVTFGIQSDSTGNILVTAFVEETNNPAPAATQYNVTGNNTPGGVGEPADESTKHVVAVANDAVGTLDCTPEAANNALPSDSTHRYTCTATSRPAETGGVAVPVFGATVTAEVISGPNDNTVPVCGFVNGAGITPDTTNNQGQVTCQYTNSGGPGLDTIANVVNAGGPAITNTDPNDEITKNWSGEARNIVCTPREATNPLGTTHTVSCTATDVLGAAVPDQLVQFNASFPGGRFTDSGTNTTIRTTNANGVVTATLFNNDTVARQTITATLGDDFGFGFTTRPNSTFSPNPECAQAANATNQGGVTAPNRRGNCADQVVKNWVASGTTPPATNPPATNPPGSQPPVNPNQPCTVPTTISISPETITAGRTVTVTVRTTPNSIVRLFAYSRPSTTYFQARIAEVGADGTAQFILTPPTNTRLYAQQQNCPASASIVVNVRTAIGISAVRNGFRNYTFSGGTLPKRPGQLVSLYRVTSTGSEVLTGQDRTDANGRWVINRVFTGSGRFGFIARTSQDLINAPGASVVRPTLIF
ncbi:MAG TPA: hypothetical protein VNA30_01950 [Mycobacteriales bacterium]|nr:hypothetical protein [Mycobacteriales bacterium]